MARASDPSRRCCSAWRTTGRPVWSRRAIWQNPSQRHCLPGTLGRCTKLRSSPARTGSARGRIPQRTCHVHHIPATSARGRSSWRCWPSRRSRSSPPRARRSRAPGAPRPSPAAGAPTRRAGTCSAALPLRGSQRAAARAARAPRCWGSRRLADRAPSRGKLPDPKQGEGGSSTRARSRGPAPFQGYQTPGRARTSRSRVAGAAPIGSLHAGHTRWPHCSQGQPPLPPPSDKYECPGRSAGCSLHRLGPPGTRTPRPPRRMPPPPPSTLDRYPGTRSAGRWR
mmetsp:Transcript_27702/g.52722  ORF Transcript_27702/g.52722 Transcript_27702/m.52722 type:complete len:282 (-) Transcript_27702:1936-2781(-)